MKLSEDNKDALKSSVLTGIASGALLYTVLSLNGSPYAACFGVLGLCSGFFIGLLTTVYPDEPSE